ncbi:MAG: GH3 auxin-responsive promoter family protein [Bacteroidia bacterium]|nr:GH3 auxin-responsive promoter family protein [Bacteroidia bacterium]
MAILGSIVKRTIDLGSKIPKRISTPYREQIKTLKKLMKKARFTAFGEHYKFSQILQQKDFVAEFRKNVPAHDYQSMFKNWWYRCLNGEPFVCWPNHIKYFALSSGTSEATSKHIPVTKDTLKQIRKITTRQILGITQFNLPKEIFESGILMLGGSTHLNYNGTYFEGDLSGITTGSSPFWFQHFQKPGKRISQYKDWNSKLEEITRNAKNWDIGVVCGVPAWIQILFEKIIDYYKVKTIHDIWPNLRIYVHGGVAIAPYRKSFERLVEHPLFYLDTYLASEGFIAYQDRPTEDGSMKLNTDVGIFFECVPFTEDNFDADGNMKKDPASVCLDEVELGKEYAILLSTCSGAWRYLIGDTVKFTDINEMRVIITGRTKHFLSLCGEHLSVDNMNRGVIQTANEMGVIVNEFTVVGIPHEGLFAHKWYIGTDKQIDAEVFKQKLDEHLNSLNDDYRVERLAALKDIFVEVLPIDLFFEFLKLQGKFGSSHKFPRVLKGKVLEDWQKFLESKGFSK